MTGFRLAAAGLLALLLVTGCGAGSQLDHDKLICKTFASAVKQPLSPVDGGPSYFGRAVALGQEAVRRKGYLRPRMAADLKAVMKTDGARRPYQAYQADCQAVGVHGQLWQWPISY